MQNIMFKYKEKLWFSQTILNYYHVEKIIV